MKYLILFIILTFSGCSANKSSEGKAVENKSINSAISLNISDNNCDTCLQTEYADQNPDTTFIFSNEKK